MPGANAIIIGAAKAGTTSLFNVLSGHPDIAPSAVKETGFFSHDGRFSRGMDWYAREYFRRAGSQSIRLEASPSYLTWSDRVAPRISTTDPARQVQFIAILRDPVKRAYSHYWHRVRLGHEPLSFAQALAAEHDRLTRHWAALSSAGNGKFGYFRAGCYAARLRPFLDTFDRRQFFFLLQEDLSPPAFAATTRRLLGFLGVDAAVSLPPVHVNTPTRARHPALTRWYWRLKRTALQPAYVTIVPRPVRRLLLDALFPPATYPPMPVEIEQRLRARYADDVQACATMIGRDLSHWLPS